MLVSCGAQLLAQTCTMHCINNGVIDTRCFDAVLGFIV